MIIVNDMETVGRDCVQAEGYEHDQEPQKKEGEENVEGTHDNRSGGHHSHQKITRQKASHLKSFNPKAKVRVQNKPLIPDEAAPYIQIPEIIHKTPSQYRR